MKFPRFELHFELHYFERELYLSSFKELNDNANLNHLDPFLRNQNQVRRTGSFFLEMPSQCPGHKHRADVQAAHLAFIRGLF